MLSALRDHLRDNPCDQALAVPDDAESLARSTGIRAARPVRLRRTISLGRELLVDLSDSVTQR
jgi:hypothetical protein